MTQPDAAQFQLDVWVLLPPYFKGTNYHGMAESVASENDTGPFSILAGHANFISIIVKKVTIYNLAKKQVAYNFNRGVLEVKDNVVRIFLGI